jgi:ammonia channel protein AmtB
MNKPLVLIAAILGIVFLVLACVYWFVPAGSLPTLMPGFAEGSTHVHVKHGLVALVLVLAARLCVGEARRLNQAAIDPDGGTATHSTAALLGQMRRMFSNGSRVTGSAKSSLADLALPTLSRLLSNTWLRCKGRPWPGRWQ